MSDKVLISHIFDTSRGDVISEEEIYKNFEKGGIPVYSSQTENNGCVGTVTEEYYNKLNKKGEANTLTWTTDGANAGKIFFRNNKYLYTNVCGKLKQKNFDYNINLEYVCLVLNSLTKEERNSVNSNPKLMSNQIEKIEIFLPSLKEQNAIVEKFKKLEQIKSKIILALEKVTELLKYNLKLQNYITIPISKIAVLNKGSNKISEEMLYCNNDPEGIPVYSSATENNGLMGRVNVKCYEKFHKKGNANELTWTTNGYAGKVFYRDINYLYSEKCGRIVIRDEYKNKILPKYLCFILNQITYKYKTSESNNGKLDIIHMEKIPIDIPIDSNEEIDIEFQKKVINIYQKIETIKNNFISIKAKLD